MSKILCFGDLHLTKEPIRLLTVMNFLDYIKEYCLKKDIKYIVNLGDFFNTPELKSNAFVPVFRKMLELSKIATIYSIVGNHECKNKGNDDTLVETFSSFGHFIQNSETINIDGIDYDFLSYTDNIEDIPNKGRVLFGHLEVDGFFYNPNKKIEGNSFTPELFDQYETVVSGHLHHIQQKNNFTFVGSPYPTNRGEGGKNNYFVVLDGTTVYLEEYNDGPDYITINANNFNSNIDYMNKIVDVELDSKVENFVKLRDILTEKGALEVNAIFIKNNLEDTGEHKINTNEGVVMSATKYLQETKVSGIDNKKLLECFKNVLTRIK